MSRVLLNYYNNSLKITARGRYKINYWGRKSSNCCQKSWMIGRHLCVGGWEVIVVDIEKGILLEQEQMNLKLLSFL